MIIGIGHIGSLNDPVVRHCSDNAPHAGSLGELWIEGMEIRGTKSISDEPRRCDVPYSRTVLGTDEAETTGHATALTGRDVSFLGAIARFLGLPSHAS